MSFHHGSDRVHVFQFSYLAGVITCQVRSTGGPSPQTATLFHVVNETVASVSSVGLVKALHLGTTNLTGLVQAADAAKGQTLFYSKVIKSQAIEQ